MTGCFGLSGGHDVRSQAFRKIQVCGSTRADVFDCQIVLSEVSLVEDVQSLAGSRQQYAHDVRHFFYFRQIEGHERLPRAGVHHDDAVRSDARGEVAAIDREDLGLLVI